jgi:DNA-binding CsgD family transcriptional regulator
MSTRKLDEIEHENIELKAKLEMLERMYRDALASRSLQAPENRDLLTKLTLKQHAVMLATLSGMSYEEIAGILQADLTTVKLHLKAAMGHLGVANRNLLAIRWKSVIDSIPDAEYTRMHGLPKEWWVSQPKAVMAALLTKRSTLYRKPAPAKKGRAK